MAKKGKIINEEIVRIAIFVELTDGSVKQVYSKPAVKMISMKFISEQEKNGMLKLLPASHIEFDFKDLKLEENDH